MGYRLYFCKKYDVEIGGGWFNWDSEDANTFIEELSNQTDPDYIFYHNEDSVEYSSIIEIEKKHFKKMIETLENEYDADEPVVGDLSDHSVYTAKEFKEIMEYILEKSDPNNDFVRLEWH